MVFAAIALAIVIADQVVKAVVVRLLPLGESVLVIPGVLALTRVQNTGAAFGLAAALPMIIPAAIALTFLFLLFYNRPRWTRRPLARGAVALLAGGAVGNLIDRVRLGAVIDYLDVFIWPVFNLADIAVTAGAALLIVSIVRQEKRHTSGSE